MRSELVKRVAGHDKEIMDGLLDKLHEIQDTKASIEKESSDLKERTAEYSEKRDRLADSETEQKQLLEAEGIRFRPNGCVNLAKYQWDC